MSEEGFMKRIRVAATLITMLALAGTATSQRARDVKRAASQISENALRAHIKFLADNLLEGRGTGVRGGELAANYLAAQLEALGLKGAGLNGSFLQPVSLVGVKADPNTRLIISSNKGKENFKFADDYVAFTGAQTDEVKVDTD